MEEQTEPLGTAIGLTVAALLILVLAIWSNLIFITGFLYIAGVLVLIAGCVGLGIEINKVVRRKRG